MEARLRVVMGWDGVGSSWRTCTLEVPFPSQLSRKTRKGRGNGMILDIHPSTLAVLARPPRLQPTIYIWITYIP